jgi:hypothetical protein
VCGRSKTLAFCLAVKAAGAMDGPAAVNQAHPSLSR